jgi:hypothetical protein
MPRVSLSSQREDWLCARVSTSTQSLDRQIGALRAERCHEVYREKASGKGDQGPAAAGMCSWSPNGTAPPGRVKFSLTSEALKRTLMQGRPGCSA